MKMSELDTKSYLGAAGSGDNSYLVVNYKDNNTDRPATYKVTLNELGKLLVNNLNLVKYEANKTLATLEATNGAYTTTALGQYIDAADRASIDTISDMTTALNAKVTEVLYSGQDKEFQYKIGNVASTILSIANLKSELALNNVNNTSDADKPVSTATQSALDLKLNVAARGAINGVASLDANGKVPSSELPSYVDDVLEYDGVANFPETGESGKIYIDTVTKKTYRWGGSSYVIIASDLAIGDTASSAFRGDYGATAYAHAVTNKGIEVAVTTNSEDPDTHEITTTKSPKLVKVQTNGEGHIIATTPISKQDILDLDILSGLGTAAVLNVPTTGDASSSEVVLGNDSRLSDARNAADVPAWAKVATAPYYTKPANGIPASDIETGVIPDITGLASTTAPTFTTSIAIGNTTLTEADLIALKSILPLPATDGTYTLVRATADDVTTYTWTAQA